MPSSATAQDRRQQESLSRLRADLPGAVAAAVAGGLSEVTARAEAAAAEVAAAAANMQSVPPGEMSVLCAGRGCRVA